MKTFMRALLAAALAVFLAASAGAAFTDALTINKQYRFAVNYMAENKIISGFPDGSFGPKKTLTRAQAAKIVCVMLEGAEKAEALTKLETDFTDVPATHWAAKYIAYCAEKGIVAGVGDGKFNPDGKLSSVAFAKMLLVAYGDDGANYSGEKWISAVQTAAKEAYLTNLTAELSIHAQQRQEAAQMAWNALFREGADQAATEDMPSRPLPTGIPESLKVYAIGNSFSNNCVLGYLYEMLKDVGVKNVTLANLYYSGCSLQTHLKYAMSGASDYRYYKRTTGDWVSTNGYTFDDALMDEDWDIITFQQVPSPTFQPAKDLLMYYVQMHHPNVNFAWNMIWAHAKTSKQSSFQETWGGDQMKMYTGMTESVLKNVGPDPRIRFIIPTGTAIQNARTSFLGDNLDRDTYHLNEGIGYYIASMVWCCKLTGCTPDQIKYVPENLLDNPPHTFDKDTPGLKDALVRVAKESVTNALAKPYEVTQSRITALT